MKIGVLTSGGDAPGMNPCIASLVREASRLGHQTVGIRRGYGGILSGETVVLRPEDVPGLYKLGGTALLCGRLPELEEPGTQKLAAEKLEAMGLGALVVLGGDGSFMGGLALSKFTGIKIVGIPATIDNNIYGSDYTLGYDTALNKLTAYIDDITDTGLSMGGRIFLVETLGAREGYFPYAAYEMGIADMCVICETSPADDEVVHQIEEKLRGKNGGSVIVTVAEGMYRTQIYYDRLTEDGYKAKINMIGYQQRGGTPTARERLHAARFAEEALKAVADDGGQGCQYVVYAGGRYKLLPFAYAVRRKPFAFRA